MGRLSRPVEELSEYYEAVVVGSGYGGAIAASRLARAGRRVAVLERGAERQPGEYPERLLAAARQVQVRRGGRRTGSSRALFEFHLGPDISVLVGCGLGGTSLINANVSLEPDPRVFDDARWPAALRGGDDPQLREGYARARRMLQPAPYPGRPPLAKLAALEQSAAALGAPFRTPEVNVTFTAGTNAAGVFQHACTMCGNCVSGCNEGAKNTVLMNYLPDAHRHGAELFTGVDVQAVTRRADGRWTVSYRPAGLGRDRFDGPELFVVADVVVLGAGSLGSTEILLRSREAGLELSGMLGRRFTGNGDVLGFAYGSAVAVNGVGTDGRDGLDPVGPCIAGMIDLRDTADVNDGFIVEEGAMPGALAPVLPAAFAAAATLAGKRRVPVPERLEVAVRRLSGLVAGVVAGPYRGALSRTQTFLVMGTDDDEGRLVLDGDGVRVQWDGVGLRPVFRRMNEALQRASAAIGGTFLVNPLWTKPFDHSLLTVHPLGGCVMGDAAEHGVVDERGRVFAGAEGGAVHDGLYVMDGAVVPRPLGVNPLLTISALAERASALLLADRGWTANGAAAPPPSSAPAAPPEPPGLRFTETMRGHISSPATADFLGAEARGRAEGSTVEFVLTVSTPDLERFLTTAGHPADLFGTVTAPALSPTALTVTDGRFELLRPWTDEVETWRMWYRMTLVSREGRRFRFVGFKVVRDHPGFDLWRDTTTLYATISDESGGAVATGVLRLTAGDLARQLTTMASPRSDGARAAARNLARFGRLFAGALLPIYGGPLDEEAAFFPEVLHEPPHRELRLPAPETAYCHGNGGWDGEARGDEWLRLIRYHGGAKGPVLLAPGFGMSTAAFACDTIDTNLAEYLVAHGYDVWLFDYRASTDLPSARSDFTIDDVARVDWPAGVAEVRRRTGAESVQVIAHCVGSMSFQMAMLAGLDGVRSAVCSQVTVHPVPPWQNHLKASVRLGSFLQRVGLRTIAPGVEGTTRDKLFDLVARALPIVPHDERCNSAVCRWIAAFYGPTHRHAQLNNDTHRAIARYFGVADVTALNHISRIVGEGHAVDARGADVYLPYPERLAIPLLFLAGAHNRIFLPATSERTVAWLRAHNDPRLYERALLRDYAHLDGFIGRRAVDDVYPLMLAHLDAHNPGGGGLSPGRRAGPAPHAAPAPSR